MAKEFSRKFYKSKQWKMTRQVYIDSVGGLCESCLLKGRLTPGYIVHHKIYLTPDNINDTAITLGLDNLRYDCLSCHNQEHHGNGEEVLREDVMFNEYGQLVKRV